MKEELKKIIEKVSNDTELKNKFKNAKDVNEVLAIAKEAGFNFTYDDLKSIQNGCDKSSELTSKELEKISGGGGCGCFIAGYGDGKNKNGDFFCQCGGAGFGAYTDFKNMDKGVCTCALHGAGATNSGGC